MKHLLKILLATGPAFMAGPAAGQAPQHDSVPLEYVQFVLNSAMFGGAPPELAVGEVPDWLSALPGARPVGSAHYRGFSISAVVVPGRGADAAAQLRAALEAAGWRPAPASGPFPQRGFIQVEETFAEVAPLCDAAGQSLAMMPRQLPGDSAALSVVVAGRGMGQCGSADRPPPEMPRQAALMPRLYAPAGSAYRGGGSSGSGTSYARLSTTMTARELALHFGAQLLEQGWHPSGQAESEDLVAHTFRHTGERGASWQALLSITALGSDRYLHLSLTELIR